MPLWAAGDELSRCILQEAGVTSGSVILFLSLLAPPPYLASQCFCNDLCSIFKNYFTSFKMWRKQRGFDKLSNDKKTFSIFRIFFH